ncbi:hypothetical protein Tco_1333779, partial [Tanacetum coccineum]
FSSQTDSQAQGQTKETVKRGTASGRTLRSLGKSQNLKKQKKKVSSVKLGRNNDESNLSEEHHDQDDHHHTAFVYEDVDATEAVVLIEEEKDASDVKSGDTEELDLERIQSTARQSTVTLRTLDFDDEAGPSSPIRPTQEEE